MTFLSKLLLEILDFPFYLEQKRIFKKNEDSFSESVVSIPLMEVPIGCCFQKITLKTPDLPFDFFFQFENIYRKDFAAAAAAVGLRFRVWGWEYWVLGFVFWV